MKNLALFLSLSLASGLLFTNLYNSIVDARSWGHDIPDSIAAAREYFKIANPGNFFRMFSPINQVLGILALVLFWNRGSSVRLTLAIALVCYLAAEGLTFGYFFPRNDTMFREAKLTDIELLKNTWSQWNFMNWVRTAILVVGVIFTCLSIHKIYRPR